MRTITVSFPDSGDERLPLLVLLPGANMSAEDLHKLGFFHAVHSRGLRFDITAVDPGFDGYLDDRIAVNLHEAIVEPALARDVPGVWFAGISIGGFGALRYAQSFRGQLAGTILLAPFLGSKGLIDQVTAAGGIRSWQPPATCKATPQRSVLDWLSRLSANDPFFQTVHMGYGIDDRFSAAHQLLAALLSEQRVLTLPGGHVESVWVALWGKMLEAGVLALRDRHGLTVQASSAPHA